MSFNYESTTYCEVSMGQCTCNAGYEPIVETTEMKKQDVHDIVDSGNPQDSNNDVLLNNDISNFMKMSFSK